VDEYRQRGRNDLRDGAFTEVASYPLEVVPKHSGWLRLSLPEPVRLGSKDCASDDDRVLMALSQNPQVRWALALGTLETAEMVEHHHHSPEWSQLGAMGTLRLTPPPSLGEAVNVLNGFHRRFSRGSTNMWMSPPEAPLPQQLTLTWERPQTLREVHLSFDNLVPSRHELPWECGTRVLPSLVAAYELSVWSQGGWQALVHEEQNHHRFRRHAFAPITSRKLRLRVLATHGRKEQARVYQVRVLGS
jgi:hypothetical protein